MNPDAKRLLIIEDVPDSGLAPELPETANKLQVSSR